MGWFKRLLRLEAKSEKSETTPATPASEPPRTTSRPSTEPPVAVPADSPFPLVSVAGAKAEQEWRRLNAEWRKEGASAVVLGDAEDVANRAEAMKCDERAPAAIVEAGASRFAKEFFQRRTEEFAQDEVDLPDDEWPSTHVVPNSLTSHTEISSGRPKASVYIAKIPTARPWEIPAFLKYGGWNDCPGSEDQVAVLKHWAEVYAIEVYAITSDVMECVAARPPSNRAAAMKLAREQFLFCSDIVHQGTEKISLLAAALRDSPNWFFWWD